MKNGLKSLLKAMSERVILRGFLTVASTPCGDYEYSDDNLFKP